MSDLIIRIISFHGCCIRIPVNASSYQNSFASECAMREKIAIKKIEAIIRILSFLGGILIIFYAFLRLLSINHIYDIIFLWKHTFLF